MSDLRPETILIDLDGTIFKHFNEGLGEQAFRDPELLPGVKEKLDAWERKGCQIIITTGRKEPMRDRTRAQLQQMGIPYDALVMGLGGGKRILINDCKADGSETAFAMNLARNEGLENVSLL